ncbi:MAG TPA: ornithine carbamoyltransferase [archaeon]|nr:ornithine carbamoyltransferase [archaeon]
MMHLLSLADLKREELRELLKKGADVKKHHEKYKDALHQRSLLTIFETTSLRTKLSFDVAMTQMGGHAIDYALSESTLGKKESMKEFAGCASRYVDGIAARLFDHKQLEEMARFSSVPVINAMTNYEHPCQILGDLMTIEEKFGRLTGLKLAYFGDGLNNVTYSLMYGCALAGVDITVASPKGKAYAPEKEVIRKAEKTSEISGSTIKVTTNPAEAAKGADIVYTDSWMSYRIPHSKEKSRIKVFKPFQVNAALMKRTNNALFMHCLPAKRGHEVTDDVIDGKSSIIFQQAENRLHIQKAILLKLLK